jgi:drug/metabolite transporter (DMT)-like permease
VTRKGWLLFAAMGVIWGIPYLFIKIAVGELSPASLVFLRTAIGAGLLLPIALARKDVRPLLPHWKWIVAYTFVEVAAPWFLLSDAERRISSSLSGLLIALVPSIGAVLAWATGADDRLDLRRIAGLGLGFLGVAALVGLDVGASDIGAVGEVALVALGYALGALIIGRKLQGLPLFGVVASSLALTMLAYAPIGIAQLPRQLPSPQVVLAVAVLGVICTALAFLVFFPLVAEVGAARATVITYVNPAVALALGVAFLSEPLTYGIVLGFVLIVFGSVLATRRSAAAKPSAALSRSPDLL